MKKLSFLLLAFCLSIFSPASTNAWDICETSMETLDVAGEISFTSSFCNRLDGEIIILEITPTNLVGIVDSVIFTKASPHLKTSESWAESFAVTSYPADMTLFKMSEKIKTILTSLMVGKVKSMRHLATCDHGEKIHYLTINMLSKSASAENAVSFANLLTQKP